MPSSEEQGAPTRPPRQYCTFLVGDLLLGIEVDRVQEVIRPQPMTAVPHAAAEVSGLINLRGQIVTAIDLRHRLGLPPCATQAARMNAVVRFDDEVVSLLVDKAGEVVEADEACFEPVPPTVPPRTRALLSAAHKLADGLMLVLNPDVLSGGDGDARGAVPAGGPSPKGAT